MTKKKVTILILIPTLLILLVIGFFFIRAYNKNELEISGLNSVKFPEDITNPQGRIGNATIEDRTESIESSVDFYKTLDAARPKINLAESVKSKKDDGSESDVIRADVNTDIRANANRLYGEEYYIPDPEGSVEHLDNTRTHREKIREMNEKRKAEREVKEEEVVYSQEYLDKQEQQRTYLKGLRLLRQEPEGLIELQDGRIIDISEYDSAQRKEFIEILTEYISKIDEELEVMK